MKQLIAKLDDNKTVYRYKCGIAVIVINGDYYSHDCHPSIHKSGSIHGMKAKGYWGKDDVIVRAGDWLYNTSRFCCHDEFDRIAARFCRCGGNHGSEG